MTDKLTDLTTPKDDECAHCTAYLDSHNSDALGAVSDDGEEFVWCGVSCLLAWMEARS